MRFRTNLAIGIASYVALGHVPPRDFQIVLFGNHSLYTLWRVMRTVFCPVERFLAIGSAGVNSNFCNFFAHTFPPVVNQGRRNRSVRPWPDKLRQNYNIFLSTIGILQGLRTSQAFYYKASEFWGAEICLECVGGRGSTPDPSGGAHDAPQTP